MTEAEPSSPQPASGNHSVQLGVGTLIVIALIVTMCSGRSEMEKLQNDTAELKQQLTVIETKLDALVENGGTVESRSTAPLTAPAGAGATPRQNP